MLINERKINLGPVYILHFLLIFLFLDLVDAGALPILITIQKMFSDDIEMCILLARIISNISLHSKYLDSIYESGKINLVILILIYYWHYYNYIFEINCL